MAKYLYLVGSILLSVIILIIAFENIQAICTDTVIFFSEVQTSTPPTFLIFWIAALGIAGGFCYHGLLTELFNKNDEEEDDF